MRDFRIRRVDSEPPADNASALPAHETCPACGAVLSGIAEPAPMSVVSAVEDLSDAAKVRLHVLWMIGLLLEVLDGRRASRQLAGLLAPAALRYLRAAADTHRSRSVSRISSIRICRPTADAIEASAVVLINTKPSALAARLDREELVWRINVVRILR
jgi:hypothetical protein